MMGTFFQGTPTSLVTPHVGPKLESLRDKRLYRVLVVDDEEVVASLARRVLEHEGCRVYYGATSGEAYHLFYEGVVSNSPFNLVLIDLFLGDDEDGGGIASAHASVGRGCCGGADDW